MTHPFIVIAHASQNCAIASPPADAGVSQAHGVILYTYPRSHLIRKGYNGCQSRWFLDDREYRKLSVTHYVNGIAVRYDNLRISGEIGYRCDYDAGQLSENSDRRCPDFDSLREKTYQAGCFDRSSLNKSGSYDLAIEHCVLE